MWEEVCLCKRFLLLLFRACHAANFSLWDEVGLCKCFLLLLFTACQLQICQIGTRCAFSNRFFWFLQHVMLVQQLDYFYIHYHLYMIQSSYQTMLCCKFLIVGRGVPLQRPFLLFTACHTANFSETIGLGLQIGQAMLQRRLISK